MRKIPSLIFALAFSASLAVQASAAWSDRPIRVIAPSTPGGAADTFARTIAEYAGPMLDTTFVVDNRGCQIIPPCRHCAISVTT
jgi:tripartite-type tricarboxylate transporter receptor subunit TctC